MNDETDGETVRWMSYAELGRIRGTSAATARRMANRKRWKKLPGNDGTMRVAVPDGLAVSRETPPETSARDVPRHAAPGSRHPRDSGDDADPATDRRPCRPRAAGA